MSRINCKEIAQVRDILKKLSGEKHLSEMKGEILEAANIANTMFEERVAFLERRGTRRPYHNRYDNRNYGNRNYGNRYGDRNNREFRPRNYQQGWQLKDVARIDEKDTETKDTEAKK
jgi:hypothetical protein